jgi:hypothetical protein
MSTLRNRAIRLAHANPTLRPHLLKAIKAADEEEEGDKTSRFTEGPEGKKEFDAWLKKQPQDVQDEWDANKDKYKNKFKAAAENLFMKAASNVFAGCEKLAPALRENCENPSFGKKKKKDDKGDDDAKGEDKKDKKKKDDGKMPAELLEKFKGKKGSALRNATIRLAHAKPELRAHLLPILAATK